MNKLLTETILPLVGTAIAAVGGVLLPWIVLELKKFIAAKTKNEQLRGVLDRLTDAAADVVRDVSATTYKELVTRSASGTLSTEDRDHLRAVALSRLREVAEKDIKDVASINGLDLPAMTSLLLAKIERAVDSMKLERIAAANATPVAPVAKA